MSSSETSRPETRDEFVTIIAPTMSGVMAEFKTRNLAALGYAIVGPAGWHRFQLADGLASSELFDGRPMLAATFHRSQPPEPEPSHFRSDLSRSTTLPN